MHLHSLKGDNKFEEAQKTVVVHLEQLKSGDEDIGELSDIDHISTHRGKLIFALRNGTLSKALIKKYNTTIPA